MTHGQYTFFNTFFNIFSEICPIPSPQTNRQRFVNLAGNNSMAKGGSGDVLAGTIAGLLEQHMAPFEATTVGVFLHACGGDEAKKSKGSYSVLARDLIQGMADAMKNAKECR